ncbi:MAG: FliA/WhiG family RNA polymerase sigma factor [Deltaproteobacteria bacterium]|jgi:RNA polymerase sigma factor for flagellar operon FliA|nr:FliA/WhiG family RNA polymerase sigma factor [Deltaproteobacteria bacterium]
MAVNSGTYGPGGQALGNSRGWKGLAMDERTVYVEKYAPLIKYLADRLAARLPDHVAREDLMSSGVLGLIDAVEKFEPDRGILFKTYAEFRIKGAMLDELRSLDWVPRAVRKKAAELEKLWRRLEAELGHPPSDEESAEAMGIELAAYHKALDEISVINMLDLEAFRVEGSSGGRESLDLYEILQDENSQDALAVLGQEELRQVLAEAIDALPEKEKLVVTLYYHEELTMKEIGQVMGYTESRISQIHTKSVVRLRGRLSRYFEHRGRGVLRSPQAKEPRPGRRGPRKREGAASAPRETAAPVAPETAEDGIPRDADDPGGPSADAAGRDSARTPALDAVRPSLSGDASGGSGGAEPSGARASAKPAEDSAYPVPDWTAASGLPADDSVGPATVPADDSAAPALVPAADSSAPATVPADDSSAPAPVPAADPPGPPSAPAAAPPLTVAPSHSPIIGGIDPAPVTPRTAAPPLTVAPSHSPVSSGIDPPPRPVHPRVAPSATPDSAGALIPPDPYLAGASPPVPSDGPRENGGHGDAG